MIKEFLPHFLNHKLLFILNIAAGWNAAMMHQQNLHEVNFACATLYALIYNLSEVDESVCLSPQVASIFDALTWGYTW